ncbi:hypothetical protein GGI07_005060 [Coemansia sp. Benny D115]|nr:hypothetical protein GGI07_005060 [Coemansia sp. Benny D115]
MQGMPPNASGVAGMDQMQQLSAMRQHPGQAMVSQHPHQGSVQQPMVGYMQPMGPPASQPGMGVAPQAMMYGQPPVRKMNVQASDRVLRSNTKNAAAASSAIDPGMPMSGHSAQQLYHAPPMRDDTVNNPSSYPQFNAPR